VIGLIAAAGVVIPTLIVAPDAAELDPAADVDELAGLDELHAARTPPSEDAEIPTSAPRWRKARRLSRPATYSSMT
jgi:hypothetical protein